MEEFFSDLLHLKTPGIEAAGVLVILVGVVLSAADIIDTVAIEPHLRRWPYWPGSLLSARSLVSLSRWRLKATGPGDAVRSGKLSRPDEFTAFNLRAVSLLFRRFSCEPMQDYK